MAVTATLEDIADGQRKLGEILSFRVKEISDLDPAAQLHELHELTDVVRFCLTYDVQCDHPISELEAVNLVGHWLRACGLSQLAEKMAELREQLSS